MKKSIAIISMLVLVFAGVLMLAMPAGSVMAADIVPDTTDKPGGAADIGDGEDALANVFARIGKILAVVAIGIAVIAIIWGAISYMLAGGDPEKAKGARTIIVNGIIGAVIIFGLAFIIGLVFSVSGQIFAF